MAPQALPTGVFGPLPPGTAGLILGWSSVSMRGLTILPGTVDADYEGEIKIMAYTLKKIITINSGDKIAQLILFPYVPEGNILQHQKRGTKAFGSSNAAYWVQKIERQHPQMQLMINGKRFLGLLDTGADVSVMTQTHWPKQWPVHSSISELQGIGQTTAPLQSAQLLKWQDSEGHMGYFQPYIIPGLPINLWGRDILKDMGVLLCSPNSIVTNMLLNQGFFPNVGLGINQQGIVEPVVPRTFTNRQELGFS